jgi:hypothetical protein
MVISGRQIHHILCLLYFVSFRWQVATKAEWRSTCIPRNKVCYRNLKLDFVDQIWLGVVLLPDAVVLSWGEPEAASVKITDGSLNKVCVFNFFYCKSIFHLLPPVCCGSLEFDGGLISLLRCHEDLHVGISIPTAATSCLAPLLMEVLGRGVDCWLC